MKYRIARSRSGRFSEQLFSSGRGYLRLENTNFSWLETHDYDCWDDCEELASTFTEFEVAILLLTFNAHDPQRVYDYEAIETK